MGTEVYFIDNCEQDQISVQPAINRFHCNYENNEAKQGGKPRPQPSLVT